MARELARYADGTRLPAIRSWGPVLVALCLMVALVGCAATDLGANPGTGGTTAATGLPAGATTSAVATGAPTAVSTPSGVNLPVPSTGNSGAVQPTGNLETDVRSVTDRDRPAVVFVGIEASLDPFSQPVPVGNGSGAIIDSQGHIVTNNHVVEQAQALKVTLPDGRSFDAQLVGRDPGSDLAVIQIQGNNLPVIPMGDSDKLQVGEWVVAIGNALGLEGGPTVTAGVVSALHRTIEEPNGVGLPDLIQTEAAINPGNSGGPLVNLQGQFVGINTAAPGPTGQGIQPTGIGFAIAINEAKPIIQELISQGHVTRPYLGIAPVTLTPAIKSQLGLTVDKGVIVASVGRGSPAEQAGLQRGDVITEADGKPVTSEVQLRQAIQAHKIGDTMQLTVVRDGGQSSTVTATLIEAPTPAPTP